LAIAIRSLRSSGAARLRRCQRDSVLPGGIGAVAAAERAPGCARRRPQPSCFCMPGHGA